MPIILQMLGVALAMALVVEVFADVAIALARFD